MLGVAGGRPEVRNQHLSFLERAAILSRFIVLVLSKVPEFFDASVSKSEWKHSVSAELAVDALLMSEEEKLKNWAREPAELTALEDERWISALNVVFAF